MYNVMLLAAGRGERLQPLTNTTPKPLLEIKTNCSLIECHLRKLQALGFRNIVINCAWLGEKIMSKLGNGSDFGVNIEYSNEGVAALETAGGVVKALPLLGTDPFIVVNADIYTDFNFQQLKLEKNKLAQLVLVANPKFHPDGDFYMYESKIHPSKGIKYTFSGIALYHPDFFKDITVRKCSLAPLIRQAIINNDVGASVYNGEWFDIGTLERLSEIQEYLK